MKKKMTDKYEERIRERQGTLVIMFINIVLFFALNAIPNLRDTLLLNPEINMIIQKPWTLVTVFFSHEIHVHLLGNMGLFFFFGSELEKITNSKVVLIVYLTAGFTGSLAIIPVTTLVGFEGLIPGASAAVFGIVTTFAVMRPYIIILASKAKWWALALFIFNAIIAILNPQTIDSASAHAVGILMGLIFGYWLKNKETTKIVMTEQAALE